MNKRDLLISALDKLQRVINLLQNKPVTQPRMTSQMETLLRDASTDIRMVLGVKQWPEPTIEEPDLETLQEWMEDDGGCEATDGCWTDPDGTCPHGHPSWLLRLGLI